jgi:hypothetical protein
MKILITENTGDTIINRIKTKGLMDTITMTGGIQTFKKLSSKFDNLSKYVDDFLNGTCSLIVSGEQIVYDFEVLDFDLEDIGDFEVLVLDINLLVNLDNLDEYEIGEYKKFLIMCAQELDYEIDISIELTDGYDIQLNIVEINGQSTKETKKEVYTGDILSDDEIDYIINKTKNVE